MTLIEDIRRKTKDSVAVFEKIASLEAELFFNNTVMPTVKERASLGYYDASIAMPKKSEAQIALLQKSVLSIIRSHGFKTQVYNGAFDISWEE